MIGQVLHADLSDQVVAESDRVSNQPNIHEPVTEGEDMDATNVNEAISDTLEDATGDIEVAEAHGSDDEVLQEDAIANEL